MMMVTHDIANVAKVADRVAIMYAAKIFEVGDIEDIFYRSHHPYTIGLINATPSIIGDLSQRRPIPGMPPSLLDPPSGCRFHPRCSYAKLLNTYSGHRKLEEALSFFLGFSVYPPFFFRFDVLIFVGKVRCG